MDRKMVCQVCAKPATGFHYKVLACGGCKAFYKRGLKKNMSFVCYDGGDCSTLADSYDQVRCKACRFRKCAVLGMRIRGIEPSPEILRLQQEAAEREIPTENNAQLRICPTANNSVSRVSPVVAYQQNFQNMMESIHSNSSLSHSSSETSKSYSSTPTHEFEALHSPTPARESSQSDDPSEEKDSYSELEILLDNLPYAARVNVSCPPSILANTRRLYPKSAYPSKFIPFIQGCAGSLTDNRHQMERTVHCLSAAVEMVFGDQLVRWKQFMEASLQNGTKTNPPETTLDKMVAAINNHYRDIVVRAEKFAEMLPGMDELGDAAKLCITNGWKWLVFGMIHHAPFMTNTESYYTIGPDNLHYSRYWQEIVSEWPLVIFFHKFCAQFQDIGLNQTERYLLLAVVLLEPGADYVNKSSSEPSLELKILHRHYADVLLDALKRRAPDDYQLAATCRKLERFFSMLKMVCRLHQFYYDSARHPCPLCTVEAKARVIQLQRTAAIRSGSPSIA